MNLTTPPTCTVPQEAQSNRSSVKVTSACQCSSRSRRVPAGHYILTRSSMSLTSPASGFNVVADLCRSVTPGSLFFFFLRLKKFHICIFMWALISYWSAGSRMLANRSRRWRRKTPRGWMFSICVDLQTCFSWTPFKARTYYRASVSLSQQLCSCAVFTAALQAPAFTFTSETFADSRASFFFKRHVPR